MHSSLPVLAVAAIFSTAVSALPPINVGSYTFPSGGQTVVWDASISSTSACGNHTIVAGSDGGPLPPKCGTAFTFEGIANLTLICAEDGYTVTGVAQGGVQVETCTDGAYDGTFCDDGVELTQEAACA